MIWNVENLTIITLKQHYDVVKTAIFYIFLFIMSTWAFIPERFAFSLEICGYFDFVKIHLKLIPPTWTLGSKQILIGSFKSGKYWKLKWLKGFESYRTPKLVDPMMHTQNYNSCNLPFQYCSFSMVYPSIYFNIPF